MKSKISKILTGLVLAAMPVLLLSACGTGKKPAETAAEATSATETVSSAPSAEAATASEAETTAAGTTAVATTAAAVTAGSADEKIIIASDVHYLAKSYRDKGPAFTDMLTHGDGRLVQYCSEITDAWKDEVISEKPNLVIVSGDLTFEGEEKSHREFAEVLKKIKDAGIPVIVIPGNHDINNHNACAYDGASVAPVGWVSPEEFAKIYADFGYDGAVSRDPASLSYVYQLDPSTRLLMIDDCQYTPKAIVGGMIRPDTYDWMEDQFADARQKGMQMITVSHHNVLDESEVYTEDCTIEHDERLVQMMKDYGVRLHLSGHLHVQHYMKSGSGQDSFYEVVTGSLTTPPCNYGILTYHADKSFSYRTANADLAAWAAKNSRDNINLKEFASYKDTFLKEVFMNQAYAEFENLGIADTLSDGDKKEMAEMYAKLNIAYYAGKAYQIAGEIKNSGGYAKWTDNGYQSKFIDYITSIISDATEDYTKLDIPAGTKP